MHRILLLSFLYACLSIPLQAQNPMGAWKWFNTCSQTSGGYGYNRVWDMCSDPQDDLIVAGTYYKEAHFSGKHATGLWLEAVGKDHWITNEKFFLAKYRKSGELAWMRTGVGGHNGGSAIKTDQLGNIYCLISCYENIYLESSEGEEISHSFGRPNGPGTLLVKYSPEGKILWHLVLDVDGVGSRDLDIGPNGEIYLLVKKRHNPRQPSMTLPSVSGKDTVLPVFPVIIPNHTPYSTIVCQYDPAGELTWTKTFDSDSLGLFGTGIAANPKGGFALGMHFMGHGDYLGLSLDARIGGSHSLILNFDEEREVVYATQFGKEVYTQHEGGSPQFQFDPDGHLVVATAVDYSPLSFSPASGDEILLEGYNQYTCYLLLLKLDDAGAIDWKYVFKDIDFNGSGSTIYPYWGNPSVNGLEIASNGQIFIVGSALNHLQLSESIAYKYAPIKEGKDWRTRNPYLAAFDSCGNPFWLESIKVNREHSPDYMSLCLHKDGDLSLGSQLFKDTEYAIQGEVIMDKNANQLLFGRRKRPLLTSGDCQQYAVIDTTHFLASDSNLVISDSIILPSPQISARDSIPTDSLIASLPPPVAKSCISALLLYPNPNQGNFNLQWNVEEEQDFEIRLTDMSGQVLRTEKRWFPKGIARMQFMGLGLAQGMYIATIVCSADVQSIRFVVGANGIPKR